MHREVELWLLSLAEQLSLLLSLEVAPAFSLPVPLAGVYPLTYQCSY